MNARFQVLAQKGIGNLSPKEGQEYIRLDRRLMRIPNSPALRMPTRLGNTLRAAELRPRDKYGLETCGLLATFVAAVTDQGEGGFERSARVSRHSSVYWDVGCPFSSLGSGSQRCRLVCLRRARAKCSHFAIPVPGRNHWLAYVFVRIPSDDWRGRSVRRSRGILVRCLPPRTIPIFAMATTG